MALAPYHENANTNIASRYLWDLFYAKLHRGKRVFSTCVSYFSTSICAEYFAYRCIYCI